VTLKCYIKGYRRGGERASLELGSVKKQKTAHLDENTFNHGGNQR
jgi:hypothetical protein